jgi:hypothetical protein
MATQSRLGFLGALVVACGVGMLIPAFLQSGKMSGNPPFHNLTYYTFGTPNGLKPAIVLEELGLQYKVEKVDITKNTQKEDWYLKINPNGRIPALKDGDQRVFETGAIMLYLTDHYDKENKLNYPHGSREYYEVLSWLMWQMGGLGPMQVRGTVRSTRSLGTDECRVKLTTFEPWLEPTLNTESSDTSMKPSASSMFWSRV